MSEAQNTAGVREPLAITCTSADCPNGLHAFRPSRDMRGSLLDGACRECHQHLIQWDRLHHRDLADVEFTFESLRVELIRHYFWHCPMPQQALDYATRKGRIKLDERVPQQVLKSVGAAIPFRDGTQTPRETSKDVNPIHFAQHATASCCRKCVEEWHGIPQGRELSDSEIHYLTELAIRYLRERMPGLAPERRKVPKR